MLKSPKSLKHSYVTHERKQVLINSSLEKLSSLDATEQEELKTAIILWPNQGIGVASYGALRHVPPQVLEILCILQLLPA